MSTASCFRIAAMEKHGAVERVVQACLEKAQALLNAAKQLIKPDSAHIAYRNYRSPGNGMSVKGSGTK
jgi:hypothetical protein